MKKVYWVIFALGIVGLCLLLPLATNIRPGKAIVATANEPPSGLVPPKSGKREGVDKMNAQKAESDQIMAKSAKAMTPALIKLLVDGLMKARKDRYQKLFDEWQTSPQDSLECLQIIKDRETLKNQALRDLWATGASGRRDFSQTMKEIRSLTDRSLKQLLGDERLTQLMIVEEEMNHRDVMKGNELARKQSPD